MRFVKTFVEVVADKKLATCVELKDIKDVSYNEDPFREITAETLLEAERFGKNFGHRGWINVPNRYDGFSHREIIWKKPKHYENAYKAMMQSWCAKQLIEL